MYVYILHIYLHTCTPTMTRTDGERSVTWVKASAILTAGGVAGSIQHVVSHYFDHYTSQGLLFVNTWHATAVGPYQEKVGTVRTLILIIQRSAFASNLQEISRSIKNRESGCTQAIWTVFGFSLVKKASRVGQNYPSGGF